MSRNYLFGFTVKSGPGHDHEEWWERMESALHPRWPDGTCGGGYSCSAPGREEVTVWLYCNKTKARRISTWLHQQLAMPATLYRLASDDDDVDQPIASWGQQ